MSIKILGGMARGFTLAVPRTDSTRPTSILVRRKLFDWRQNLEGYVFIDLCAGTGAMGLEALSRGAMQIYLNEFHRSAFLTLKENARKFIDAFKLDSKCIEMTSLDAQKWIEKELSYHFSEQNENVIIYVDPPYENHKLYNEILDSLRKINFKGEVWVESDRLKGPKSEELMRVFHSVIKTVEQGDHFVVVGFLV